MKGISFLLVGAIAVAFAGSSAQAAFDYTVTITELNGVSVNPPGGNATATFTDSNYEIILTGTSATGLPTVDLQTLALSSLSVVIPGTATGVSAVNLAYSLLVTINNPGSSANYGPITVSGVLSGNAGEVEGNPYSYITNSFTTPPPVPASPIDIGGSPFQFVNLSYTPATANGSPGGIGATLLIPEPSSVAMLGLGGLGLVLAARRRRIAA